MPIPFFVYVVESPSAPDIYHRRAEGDVLERAIRLGGTPCVTRCAISREAFEAALGIGLQEEMERLKPRIPLLHISAHGNGDGIELSNGEFMEWDQLKKLIKPLNKALAGRLLVCMSSCEGFAGMRMAMSSKDPELPFLALVGGSGKPTWPDTAVAFAAFYHRLAKGAFVPDAVEAMKAASGHEHFFEIRAVEAHKSYLDYIRNFDSSSACQQLGGSGAPSRLDKFATVAQTDGGLLPAAGTPASPAKA